jgi:CRISPR-associated protein Cas1
MAETLSAKLFTTVSDEPPGQYNLFTGELERLPQERAALPEEAWLFDPDFGLVLPDDPAGKEVLVEPGVALQFPVQGLRTRGSGLGRGRSPSLKFETEDRHHVEPRVARTEDAAQLILSGFGIYLGKKSERLQIKVGGKVAKGADGSAYEFPFFRISEVVIASRGVSISSDLVREFCERGIRLSFVEPSGRPYAMLTSPILTATVESRREQLLAYNDARGLEFARLIVRGKVRNQRHLLLYCGKYLKQSDPDRHALLAELAQKLRQLEIAARKVEGATIAEKRQELMGLEGVAGRLYWQGFKTVVESKAEFMGRVHRGADDALNALLNYGYGILYAQVWGAVVNAGLEPFAGFLHVDRPGKPSLVLDLVEEFRQPVVDRTVIAYVNLGQTLEMKEGMLDEGSRRALAERILQRLASPEPFRGQQFQIRSIIQMQARSLVGFLRGKGKYKPFSFRW